MGRHTLTAILLLAVVTLAVLAPAAEARPLRVVWGGMIDWGLYETLGLRSVNEVDPYRNVVVDEERLIPIVVLPGFEVQLYSNFNYYRLTIYDDWGTIRAYISTMGDDLRVEGCNSPGGEVQYHYPPEPARDFGGGCGVSMEYNVDPGEVVIVRVDVNPSGYSEPGKPVWVEALVTVEVGGATLMEARLLDYGGFSLIHYAEAVNAALPIGPNAKFTGSGVVRAPGFMLLPFAVQDVSWELPLSFEASAWGPFMESWGTLTITSTDVTPTTVQLNVEAKDVYRGLLYLVEIELPSLQVYSETRTYSWVDVKTYTWQGEATVVTQTDFEYETLVYNKYIVNLNVYDAKGETVAKLNLGSLLGLPAQDTRDEGTQLVALIGLGLAATLAILWLLGSRGGSGG